jgi:hypothetical protein
MVLPIFLDQQGNKNEIVDPVTMEPLPPRYLSESTAYFLNCILDMIPQTFLDQKGNKK